MTGSRLTRMSQILEQRRGKRDHIKQELDAAQLREKVSTAQLEDLEEAQSIIRIVAKKTQEQLEYHISELVTLALSAVFPDPYELVVRFEERRGKTEADLLFRRDGDEIQPMEASGGGPVDVAAFALRVALWSLRRPRSRATMPLDEPFRFVSRDLQPKASQMLKEVSERLGLQIIMVSHSEDLIEAADRVFRTTMSKGVSLVEVRKCLPPPDTTLMK